MTPAISVIICTYNPRAAYLQRTLDALLTQTFPAEQWELVIIDNNSSPAVTVLAEKAKVIREENQGLTHARLRGIRETTAPLLIFVDDDNVLDPHYLERSAQIAAEFPHISAFGGQSHPEFEISPPEWLKPFYSHLALASFDADRWSNQRDFRVFPIGAGLCIRRDMAVRYANEVERDPARQNFGRKGTNLISAEDTDMVLTCVKAGHGIGRFERLRLLHLIPKERLDYGYNKRLAYAMGYSLGRLAAQDEGSNRIRNTMQFFRMAAYFVLGKKRGPARWIEGSLNYGHWKGLVGLAP